MRVSKMKQPNKINQFTSPTKCKSILIIFAIFTACYILDATPVVSREYTAYPLPQFSTDNFVGSGDCTACHSLLFDEKGNSVSIKDHWRSTMMSNAAKDPLWQAKVSSEIARNPSIKTVIEQKCVICHMPMAWVDSNNTKNPLGFTPDINSPDHKLHYIARDGVSCSLCHQIQDKYLGTKESFSGKYKIDTNTKRPDKKIFGPFKEVEQKTMQTSVGYTPVHGKHMLSSKFCATCHTLYTPYVDAAGKVAGSFPEQTSFLEWQQSTFGNGNDDDRSCQECHMPLVDGKVQIARYAPSSVKAKFGFAKHHFVGGNIQMLRLLKNNVTTLKLTASSNDFNNTIERTKKQLQENTAELAITSTKLQDGSLETVIEITSKVGHKFPTGIPCRRAWLHLVVKDEGGNIIFESGRPKADGSITGNINDAQPNTFEQHYDLITQPDQVQIYENIMANTDGQVTYTLLRAGSYLKDNRLLPPGFNKENVIADIGVYGKAASDANFIGGSDRVTYHVPLHNTTGPVTIEAKLYYTALSFSFLEDLKKDKLPLVENFFSLWEKADKSPTLITTAITKVR